MHRSDDPSSQSLSDMGASVQYDSGLTLAHLPGFSTPGRVPNWQFHPLSDRLSPPNDPAQQPAHAGDTLWLDEPCIAWPVCCSRLLAPSGCLLALLPLFLFDVNAWLQDRDQPAILVAGATR